MKNLVMICLCLISLTGLAGTTNVPPYYVHNLSNAYVAFLGYDQAMNFHAYRTNWFGLRSNWTVTVSTTNINLYTTNPASGTATNVSIYFERAGKNITIKGVKARSW